MSIQIDGKTLLTPEEARKKLEIGESKLRRLSQLGIIPSISAGIRGNPEKGPKIRFYDEQVLNQLDPLIRESLKPGVKTSGNQQYYSRRRCKED